MAHGLAEADEQVEDVRVVVEQHARAHVRVELRRGRGSGSGDAVSAAQHELARCATAAAAQPRRPHTARCCVCLPEAAAQNAHAPAPGSACRAPRKSPPRGRQTGPCAQSPSCVHADRGRRAEQARRYLARLLLPHGPSLCALHERAGCSAPAGALVGVAPRSTAACTAPHLGGSARSSAHCVLVRRSRMRGRISFLRMSMARRPRSV